MNTNRRLQRAGLLALLPGLASCGAMNSVSSSTAAMMDKVKAIATPDGWGGGDTPAIAVVREKDLKKLPLGHERAMAYQQAGGGAVWTMGPIEFEPGSLPEDGEEGAEILLPPLVP